MSIAAKKKSGFGPKSRIDHAVHGLGTVVEVSDLYTTIQFDEAGLRRFSNGLVQLQSTDTPAPERPVRKKRTTKAAKAGVEKVAKKTAKAE